ncbi:MAG: M48 family metallopeptidase [Candidatus Omnitrophota bacterium]
MVEPAKKYSSLKYTFSILETVYQLIFFLALLSLGLSKALSALLLNFIPQNPCFVIPLYTLVVFLVYYLSTLPINFYHSYILERKFSLSNQKIKDWVNDQAKAGIISYIIALIIISAFYYILKHFIGSWWLVISLFWIFFSLILAKLTPILIIPLFFKYKKISDDALRGRIMNLANKMKVKILDCFEIDFSKKTLKANAAFVGWGSGRRVILSDTLKDKYSYDEIEVILAHEFAHYRLKHLLKLILVNSAVIITCFYIISRTSVYTLSVFGLGSLSDIAALPLILIYFLLFGIVMQPFESYISRRLEINADMMALKVTGLKEAFISMMEKLASQNLADRNPHPLIKFFFFDHPPIDERINMAKSFQSSI